MKVGLSLQPIKNNSRQVGLWALKVLAWGKKNYIYILTSMRNYYLTGLVVRPAE